MSVEKARGDIVKNGFVLDLNDLHHAIIALRVIKDGGVGGSAGVDDPPLSIDQRFQKVSSGAAFLSLNEKREPGVGDGRG